MVKKVGGSDANNFTSKTVKKTVKRKLKILLARALIRKLLILYR